MSHTWPCPGHLHCQFDYELEPGDNMILYCFYMILYGFYMILYGFYMILYGFYMNLYDFI